VPESEGGILPLKPLDGHLAVGVGFTPMDEVLTLPCPHCVGHGHRSYVNGPELERRRLAAGLPITAVAEELGVAHQYLRRVERGQAWALADDATVQKFFTAIDRAASATPKETATP
jgi:hypothetical protein